MLSGGWHFSTEVARALDGAAILPEPGIEALKGRVGTREGSPAPAAGGAE